MAVEPGLSASVHLRVTHADTAQVLGSGDVPVLGTPRLLALAEAATVAAIAKHLDTGQSSVGTRVQLEHLRPSAVGADVTVRAELVHVDGRLLRFQVVAEDDTGQLLGNGEVTRVVVDRERFLSRI